MRYTPLLIFFLLIPTAIINGASVTERQALLSALEHRYEVRILHLENSRDSLNVELQETRWLPQISLRTGLSAKSFDSTSSSLFENTNSLSASQHLPGGGGISGSLRFDNTVNIENTDSTTQGTAVQLQFTQPLLRNAWKADSIVYEITLARLDNQRFTLEQLQRMLNYSSDIRTRFWNLFEAQALVSLYEQEEAYAKQRLETERTRLTLGISPPLDTLSAKLSYINAYARLHDARSSLIQLQEELAFYSGIDDRTLTIDSAIDFSTPDLPEPDTMIARAERFDPQLRIFDIAAERLERVRKQTRNKLLPSVYLTASWQRSFDENSSTRINDFTNNSVIGLIASYNLPVKPRRISLRQNAIASDINSLERENHLRQLRLRLSELQRSWARERRAIEIAASAEEVARQTLVATREGYSVGTVDRLSLDKAENDYRSARIELLRKQLLMKQLEIVFDEITGATLTNLGVHVQ